MIWSVWDLASLDSLSPWSSRVCCSDSLVPGSSAGENKRALGVRNQRAASGELNAQVRNGPLSSTGGLSVSEMRWRPILFDLAVVIVMWTIVLVFTRQRRLRVAADPSPRRMRGHRLHTAALISVAVGFTWFIAWFVSDAIGPQWLHSLSLPTALVFIAAGAVLAGYAGWIGGP